MTSSFAPGTRAKGALLLADISGYTGFLQGVADAHHAIIVEADEPPPAYAVLSKLLDTIVATLSPAYRLAKFEGDAVFAVADDAPPRGDDVLAGLRRVLRGVSRGPRCGRHAVDLLPATPARGSGPST